MDNFSKSYTTRVPSENVGPFRQCLWSVSALRPSPVDFAIQKTDENETISAMPNELYVGADDLYDLLGKYDAEPPFTYNTCFSTKNQLYTIPPGPPRTNMMTPKSAKFWKNAADTSFKTFNPRGIHEPNMGSQVGMIEVLMGWWRARNATKAGRGKYGMIVSDINVFDRLLKVNNTSIFWSIFSQL